MDLKIDIFISTNNFNYYLLFLGKLVNNRCVNTNSTYYWFYFNVIEYWSIKIKIQKTKIFNLDVLYFNK
ncbi:hypothetical protein LCGC14_1861990, partial [marine sediment metagenome]